MNTVRSGSDKRSPADGKRYPYKKASGSTRTAPSGVELSPRPDGQKHARGATRTAPGGVDLSPRPDGQKRGGQTPVHAAGIDLSHKHYVPKSSGEPKRSSNVGHSFPPSDQKQYSAKPHRRSDSGAMSR